MFVQVFPDIREDERRLVAGPSEQWPRTHWGEGVGPRDQRHCHRSLLPARQRSVIHQPSTLQFILTEFNIVSAFILYHKTFFIFSGDQSLSYNLLITSLYYLLKWLTSFILLCDFISCCSWLLSNLNSCHLFNRIYRRIWRFQHLPERFECFYRSWEPSKD